MRIWLLALLAAACGSKEGWPEGRPRIDAVRFLEQTPLNPMRLAFELEYYDADADLEGGALILSIDCEEVSVIPLGDLFANQIPPVDPSMAEGRFEVYVTVDTAVTTGERIEFGFALEDGQGQRSNEPSVTLEAIQK